VFLATRVPSLCYANQTTFDSVGEFGCGGGMHEGGSGRASLAVVRMELVCLHRLLVAQCQTVDIELQWPVLTCISSMSMSCCMPAGRTCGFLMLAHLFDRPLFLAKSVPTSRDSRPLL
jgi:hypothetical protein